jgi:acetyl esterase/lipase
MCLDMPGLDDPLCNPFSEAAGGNTVRVTAESVLVCVAEKDSLRDRGVCYYGSLKGCGYRSAVELHQSEGQGHYGDLACEQARELHARVLRFLRHQ